MLGLAWLWQNTWSDLVLNSVQLVHIYNNSHSATAIVVRALLLLGDFSSYKVRAYIEQGFRNSKNELVWADFRLCEIFPSSLFADSTL